MSKPLQVGILGGGQLGRMLLQVAANYPVQTHVLEKGKESPASTLCHFYTNGDIKDYQSAYDFGKDLDVITIEIEHVNLDALYQLEKEGKKVYPKPAALAIIKDKGLQKEFYRKNNIPTSDFVLLKDKTAIADHLSFLPAAQKLRHGGYDGKGVQILKSESDLSDAFQEPSVLEKLVDIDKEISVIVAKNECGEIAVYPPVEMVFDPRYNLVDYLISPAELSNEQVKTSQQLAHQVVEALESPGIFAVEMFLDKKGNILVNETAPRTHNSGHQSIEGNYCSQYDMQMRVLQNLPLGNTDVIQPSLMLNLIGEPLASGTAVYEGLNEALSQKGVYLHVYGKTETKPGRKMGHVTILGKDKEELLSKAEFIKSKLKVTA